MRDQIFLILDYETRSRADLKKTGSFEYAAHPSTRILCVAYRIGTKDGLAHQLKNKTPCRIWYPAFTAMPESLFSAMVDRDILTGAHNAGFEQAITRFVLKINIPIHRWFCTAAMAASFALPRSLFLVLLRGSNILLL